MRRPRTIHRLGGLLAAALLAGCERGSPRPELKDPGKEPASSAPAAPAAVSAVKEPLSELPLGLDAYALKVPADNPVTPAKVELGRHLYFDARLSRDGTVACATCHVAAKGWSNGLKTAVGIGNHVGKRSAPTVINRAFSTLQFWDGRAASLEDQALGPIQNPGEMGNTLENVVATVKGIAGYVPLFVAAFGDEAVSPDRIAKAIASFERTILSGSSPYDRYQSGEKSALNEEAVRGMQVFLDNNKGRCSICHAGFNFTDEKFHNIGIGADKPDWEKEHIGRFEVTKAEKDKGAYKTPTLRQIAATGPYMHDGSEATLEAVVEYYAKGGNPNPHLDPEMKKLTLTDQEKRDLVEFLKALTGDVTRVERPEPLK
ncbi:MAG: c-type cytochrome [Planctomycetes bacterium]|nr:c-type cytochrome [Planctomycetota bacterium]